MLRLHRLNQIHTPRVDAEDPSVWFLNLQHRIAIKGSLVGAVPVLQGNADLDDFAIAECNADGHIYQSSSGCYCLNGRAPSGH